MTATELIAALEAATEGSHELDCEIWDTFGWHKPRSIKRYTTSLDAALTLALPGWKWNIRTELHASFRDCAANVEVMDRDWADPLASYGICKEGHAATPPLALCAAWLRAREAR